MKLFEMEKWEFVYLNCGKKFQPTHKIEPTM